MAQVLMDIDIFGRENPDGTAKEYYEDEAIKMALITWLTSKKGDFLMEPTEGGIIHDTLLFKNMTASKVSQVSFAIKNAINNGFVPDIDIRKILIEPDYENRMWIIEIYFTNPESGNHSEVQIFTKDLSQKLTYTYEDVPFTEDNLYNFVRIKQVNIPDERLVFNPESGYWEWGKYRLINLTPSDSKFSDILSLING